MNAIYVTVSIPLLLVLAGFNHAHGLTTFGKSNSQNTQQAHPPPAQGKSCTSQQNCTYIKDTTCLNSFCYCGDNKFPVNGVCKTQIKGANHLCTTDNECVEGANCFPAKDRNKTSFGDLKICVCEEGLYETPSGRCGGTSNFIVLPGLAMIVALLATTMN